MASVTSVMYSRLRNTPARAARQLQLAAAPAPARAPRRARATPARTPAPAAAAASITNGASFANGPTTTNATSAAGSATPTTIEDITMAAAAPSTPQRRVYLRAPRAPRKTGVWKQPRAATPSPASSAAPAGAPRARKAARRTTEYTLSREIGADAARAHAALKARFVDATRRCRALEGQLLAARAQAEEDKAAFEEQIATLRVGHDALDGLYGRLARLEDAVWTNMAAPQRGEGQGRRVRIEAPRAQTPRAQAPRALMRQGALGPCGTEVFDQYGRVYVEQEQHMADGQWVTRGVLAGLPESVEEDAD